ncbi:MAG: hypothetical protein K2W95_22560 [Candidatus Obscuribacterales bacterium]|nr:hypothetical protein [Candidatus Obscuribacterales bacterium]
MVIFAPTYIEFSSYPYTAASVYPAGKITAQEIADVGISCAPPEIRLKKCETIFVPASDREKLKTWCEKNAVPLVDRLDVWGLLLDPFLDTEFSPEQQERTLQLLAQCGIPPAESAAIRARVERVMISYNVDSMLWEWVNLGLTDILDAYGGKLASPVHRLSQHQYSNFYAYAMEIASRAKPLTRHPDK